MGCGNSKERPPSTIASRRRTGVRRASDSSSASDSSDKSNIRKHKVKERKHSLDKKTENENDISQGYIERRGKKEVDSKGSLEEKKQEDTIAIGWGNSWTEEGAKESEKDGTLTLGNNEKENVICKEEDRDTNIEEEVESKTCKDLEKTSLQENEDKISSEKETTPEKENLAANDNGRDVAHDEVEGAEKDEEIVNDIEKEREITVEEPINMAEDGSVDREERNSELLGPAHDNDEKKTESNEVAAGMLSEGAATEDEHEELYTSFDDEDVEIDTNDDVDGDGYAADDFGLMIKSVECRKTVSKEEADKRPEVDSGGLYTDKDFPLEIAIVEGASGIEWKRPKEFAEDPKLVSDGACHYDIGQGSAGTCWFLSTVSVIAAKTDMIQKIVPNTAYQIEDPERYDGIFHARFYRFGQWEDIYIDDYLPVIYGNVLWGAKSSTDKNEFWVPLLEKAFARLHGSYDAIYGGQSGDAYLQLTGGIGERLEIDKDDKTSALFKRIQNALTSGSQVTCVVPAEFDGHLGLVGGHAYSLVGVAKVNKTKLVRVRNPWGHGEWIGPWSDKSEDWQSVTDDSVAPPNRDDGEFFVCLEDFTKYFSHTTICSLTPDFDCDGVSDSLKYVLSVFGEWTEDKNGAFTDRVTNPRYAFTITEKGMREDGTVPFVVQIIQHSTRRSADHSSMRCDIFKIHADKSKKHGRVCAVEIQGKKTNVYTTELQSSFRHKLKPGRYMAIPSTCDGGVNKAFLLRMFTPAAIKNVKEVPIATTVMSCDNEDVFVHGPKEHCLTFEKTILGDFISDVNAGGQVSHRDSYSKNPQFCISIPDVGETVPIVIHIMQTQVDPKYPVGFRLFPLDKGVVPPVDVNYLYDKYNDSPFHEEGSQSKFVISWDVDVRYMLPAGRYVGLIHLDAPNTEKSFAVLFKSNNSISIRGFQTGE